MRTSFLRFALSCFINGLTAAIAAVNVPSGMSKVESLGTIAAVNELLMLSLIVAAEKSFSGLGLISAYFDGPEIVCIALVEGWARSASEGFVQLHHHLILRGQAPSGFDLRPARQ
jgi:hypothetical protein